MPEGILDLFTEFRALTNGLPTVAGSSLLGALTHFGLDNIGAIEKEDMRELVLGGGPWSEQEQADILDYCESDVDALKRLLPAMLPTIDLPRALLRGRYMAAAANMEHNGVPIDMMMLDRLRRIGPRSKINSLSRSIGTMACSTVGRLRPIGSPPGWRATTSHGRD